MWKESHDIDFNARSFPLTLSSLLYFSPKIADFWTKIEKLDLSLLLPAHGEEVEDVRGLIHKIFAHHKDRMDHVLFSLSKGEKTPFEIAMDLFPGVPPFEIFLGISEAVGHLEILKGKGIVKLKEKQGKDYYSLGTWWQLILLNLVDLFILNE